MKPKRKSAKDFLQRCNRASYEKVIYASKLTPRQKQILHMKFIEDESVIAISCEMNISESAVERELANAYEKISAEI